MRARGTRLSSCAVVLIAAGCATPPPAEPHGRRRSEVVAPKVTVLTGPASSERRPTSAHPEPASPAATAPTSRAPAEARERRAAAQPGAQAQASGPGSGRAASESELLALVGGAQLGGLSPADQAKTRARALMDLAALRAARQDHDGASEAMARAVREAEASGDAALRRALATERVRTDRAAAMARADQSDFAGALRRLDALLLVPGLTPEDRRAVNGDRFVVMERRAERAERGVGGPLALPGEERVDEKAVLAEVDRVFGPLSSFGNPEVDAALARATTAGVGFELGLGAASRPTLAMVATTAEASERQQTSSAATRGHTPAREERVTVAFATGAASSMERRSAAELPTASLPKASEAPLVETGRFDQRTVFAMVSLHKAAVTQCYERSLRAGEKLGGKLEVRMTVQPTGIVSLAEIASKDHAATELGRCVATTLGRWRFPPFDGDASTVTIPFFLKDAG